MFRFVLAALLSLVACCSMQAQTYLAYKNVAYDTISGVDERLLSMDVYVPKGGRIELPVVMYVHGGGWQGGDKANVDSLAKAFTDSAWVFVSVNYRLAPACPPCDTTSSTAVRATIEARDVAKAIAFVKARIGRYNGDGRRICLLGDEAGGHLALLVATNSEFLQAHGVASSNVKAVCTVATTLYNVPLSISTSTGSMHSLYLNAFGTDPVEYMRTSPADHLTEARSYAPLLCYSDTAAGGQGALSAFADSCMKAGRSIKTGTMANIDTIRVFFRAAVPLAPLSVHDGDVPPFTVRPNPARDVVTVDGVNAGGRLTLVDVVGREIQTMEHIEGTVRFTVPSGLPSAVYLLRYESGSQVVVQSIMIE